MYLAWEGQVDVVLLTPGHPADVATSLDVLVAAFWHMADTIPAVGIVSAFDWDKPIEIEGAYAWLAGVPMLAARAWMSLGVIGVVIEGAKLLSHRRDGARDHS